MSHTKRVIVGLVAFALLNPVSVLAKGYSDVPSNYKHHVAIAGMTEMGALTGYPNGEFRPESHINRAEVVAVLTRSKFPPNTLEASLDWHKNENHHYVIFPDVAIHEWYGKNVAVAYQNSIIQGYPDGTFKGGNDMNFAEALKVILEAYKVDLTGAYFQPNKLLYVKSGDWHEKYFMYAYEHNLINQRKFYHPGQKITRGEFAETVFRLEMVLKNSFPEFIAKALPNSDEYKITIPKLGVINVDVNVADVYDAKSALSLLKNGLGQYLHAPDEQKKTILFGHSSGYSWDNSNYKTILREINQLQNGDRIYLNYKEKGYVFEVFQSEIIPANRDYQLVQNPEEHELAIYTCWPPNSIKERYVVYGKPV